MGYVYGGGNVGVRIIWRPLRMRRISDNECAASVGMPHAGSRAHQARPSGDGCPPRHSATGRSAAPNPAPAPAAGSSSSTAAKLGMAETDGAPAGRGKPWEFQRKAKEAAEQAGERLACFLWSAGERKAVTQIDGRQSPGLLGPGREGNCRKNCKKHAPGRGRRSGAAPACCAQRACGNLGARQAPPDCRGGARGPPAARRGG